MFIDTFVVGLVATGQYTYAGSTNGRIFHSGDRGETWTQIRTVSPSGTFGQILVHPNGLLCVTTFDGEIFCSTNDGNLWTYRGFKDLSMTMAINSNRILFAGGIIGIFRSTDKGGMWISINSGLMNLSINCGGIDPRGFVFIGTAEEPVFVSTQSTNSIDRYIEPPPLKYKLYQNYPNPFNPSTRIEYEVLKNQM